MTTAVTRTTETQGSDTEWWRDAVIYQIYPRSFADGDGNGIGDLPGITQRLHLIKELGVDAVWLSPFYVSPQADGGYDVADFRDVDPLFGTLADADALIARAHELGLKIIIDIVPNHTSDKHVWFHEAQTAEIDSPARHRYIYRDGRGPDGDEPPNNWTSVFGGPAWTRETRPDGSKGQWYLHLFDSTQPDLNWSNPEVVAEFEDILRFWLDRGVDGFRVDVAHGLIKEDGLPDHFPSQDGGSMGGNEFVATPYFGQDGVHDVWRGWRKVLDAHGPGHVLVAEAWIYPLTRMANWVRSDEMHQAFNFPYLETPWDAAAQRSMIDQSLAAFNGVGAPATWVLSNHDVIRHASRLGLAEGSPQGHGIGPKSEHQPDSELGLARARAATLMMLALPGSSYIYQGEELGLPEHVHIPDEARQDPTWFRTNKERYGRDGCRVPIPWEASAPAYGFSTTGASWLPQPDAWASLARDAQEGDPSSTLELYKRALALRAQHQLGRGTIEWLELGEGVIAFDNSGVRVIANVSAAPVPLDGEVLAASAPVSDTVPPNTTVWLERR